MELKPYFCGKDCGGDACPLMAEIENGRVVGMRHNPAAGRWIRACGKGMRAPEAHYSPHRILSPLIRTGPRGSGSFREARWDEALSLIAARLQEIHSKGARTMCISSAGSTGALHNTEVLSRRFFNSIGGGVFVAGSYSNNAAKYALSSMFGGSLGETGFDADTLEWSNLIVLWGANPLEARLGSELPARLVDARRRG
ncbi:MAG: molybdopterin-dependent oxidoreductase, partial [Rectinema sp.]|nr:molybdopterin-dependent oxidoreductase [Rectinema sp.]